MGDGEEGAWGTQDRKTSCLLRDSASAAVLLAPAMWRASIEICQWAVKKCRQRSKCMSNGSLADPLESAQTTAILSEMALTVVDLQDGPQMAAAITTGTISLADIWRACHEGGHSTWNHCAESLTAPQPHEPDASEVKK